MGYTKEGEMVKKGKCLRKDIWFFGQQVLLTCRSGSFPALFFPRPIPQTGSGEVFCLL